MKRDLRQALRSELRRVRIGRATTLTLSSGLLLTGVTAYGYLEVGKQAQSSGFADGTVVESIVRAWMMMFLFSAILGVLVVTRDLSGQTIGRAVLAYGGRDRVFGVKTLASVIVGIGVAALVAVAAPASAYLLVSRSGHEVVWTHDTTLTLLGVCAASVLAGPWGSAVGWVIRHQTGAVAATVVVTVMLEPAIQRLAPDASAYLFTIALSAIYRDGKPELLPIGWAFGCALAWIAVLGATGRQAWHVRDVR